MKNNGNENKITEQERKVFSEFDLLADNSPHEFIDNYSNEAKILNAQIKNPRVCNIAVTGKFGAGKSSAINTYLSIYRNKKCKKDIKNKLPLGSPNLNGYARVSLASFNDKKVDEVAIEKSILQQLLYSNTKSDLSNSKIERTNKTPVLRSLLFTVCILLFVLSAIFTGTTMAAVSFVDIIWLKYIFLGVATLSAGCIIFVLIHYKKLHKVKYKDIEIELSKTNESNYYTQSLINKFLDEVLYFFECENIDLVIFEDLDRFNNYNDIFVKLRELNTLINGSKKRAPKVTFIYCVKNNVFNNEEERSKFFDFILPIIPTVNPVNAESKIKEKLNEFSAKNVLLNLNDSYINGISIYIPDMRVLNNTFNDYLIMYYKIFLDKNKASYMAEEKLFGLCLYKNLFPQDYALLESGKGLIPFVINMSQLHRNCVKNINNEIASLEQKMIDFQQESLDSFKELKQLFIGKLYEMGYNRYSSGSISVENICTFKDLSLRNLRHPRNDCGIDTKYQDDIVDEFYERELLIKEKNQDGIKKTQNRIKELKKERYLVYSMKFIDIVKRYGLDFCFSAYYAEKEQNIDSYFAKIPDVQLRYLRFLISKNYIDEHFIEYTSNYEAKLLSPNDTKVLQSIRGGEFNFEANIDNIASIIAFLDDDVFLCGDVLTRTLLNNIDVLRSSSLKNIDTKWQNIMLLLKEADDKYRDAIRDYFVTENFENCDKLLSFILSECLDLCMWILGSPIDDVARDKIMCGFIKYVDYNILDENTIREYLSNHDNYMQLFELVGDDKKVCDFIDVFKPKFKYMSHDALDSDIQKFIAANNYFEISVSNIKTVMQIFEHDTDLLNSCNYTTIVDSRIDSLIKYVGDNIDYYVSSVLLSENVSCKHESIERFAELLKNENVNLDNRKALIKKYNKVFESIKDFNPELFSTMFVQKVVAATWENILFAYEKNGLVGLPAFIIASKNPDSDFWRGNNIQKDTPTRFINDILKNVSGNDLEFVLDKFNVRVKVAQLNISDIPDNNLAVFIKKKCLEYDRTFFDELYEKQKSLCEYIRQNQEKITSDLNVLIEPISQASNYTIMNKMIGSVIACNGIDVIIKKQLIDEFYDKISIKEHERIYLDYIIDEQQSVPLDILWQYSSIGSVITAKEKMGIFIACANKINFIDYRDEIIEYLINIDSSWSNYFNGEEIEFDNNDIIERLLKILNSLGVVRYSKSKKKFCVHHFKE